MQLTGRNLPYIPLAKKHYSITILAKKLYKMSGIENAIYIISFNGVKPQSRLPPWHLFWTNGFCFFKNNYNNNNNNNNKTIPEINIILAEIQYMNERITSLMELSLNSFFCITCVSKEGFHLSQILCVFCSLVSFVWKGMLHTWSHVSSLNDCCIHTLLFQKKKSKENIVA